VNLAAALTSIQEWEGAIQAHLDALSINGNLFGVRSDLGNIFKSLGRLDEAEENIRYCPHQLKATNEELLHG
jgi:protein O-GlcNAc transferase